MKYTCFPKPIPLTYFKRFETLQKEIIYIKKVTKFKVWL